MARLQQGLAGSLPSVTIQCTYIVSFTSMVLRPAQRNRGSHNKFARVQIFHHVGSWRHTHDGGVCKVQEICPGFTVLDSAPDLALPCWTLIWG